MNTTRLYGLYIHNLTKTHSDRDIALESINKFMTQKPPLQYEYGDVLILQPENDIAHIIYPIVVKNGFVADFIAPNQLYRLMDSVVVHYIFVDEFMNQKAVEKFVYDWEISNRLTMADMRYTRYLQTYFIPKKT